MKNIFQNINESDKDKKWYFKIQSIQAILNEKFNGWWGQDRNYSTIKRCIICDKEPICLDKNWLSRDEYGKSKYGVMVFVAKGKKDPTKS